MWGTFPTIMNRLIPFCCTFVAAIALGACADGPNDYECTVTWTIGTESITESFSYEDLDNAQDAVNLCTENQADHASRPSPGPGETLKHECECEST